MKNKNIINRWVYSSILLAFFLLALSLPHQAQEHEKIIEKVQVENVEIPVRIFDKGQPVGGLAKEDFQLFVDGKPKPVNGFFETRKKLEDTPAAPGSAPETAPNQPPRLFVLIFNLSSFTQDLDSHLNTLFHRIIRPNDRLMAITNHYFISEWKVDNSENAKNKVKGVLEKEINKLRFEILRIENELKAHAATLKSLLDMKSSGSNLEIDVRDPEAAITNFFYAYQFVIDDIKDNYLSIPVDQYIKIAEYLKSQPLDKWVLNFYQLGRLPLLDEQGEVVRSLNRFLDQERTAKRKLTFENLYHDFIKKVKMIDSLFINDIGKTFLKSGATVHTQLLNPFTRDLSDDFKYEAVNLESENILRELSRMTGGSVVNSNRTEKFVDNITAREDIVYTLSYSPGQEKKKRSKLDIKIKDKNYRVVFDDQRRMNVFNDFMVKLTEGIKDIEIEALAYNNDFITFKLKNLQVVQYEGENFWAVQVQLKILDKHSRFITGLEKIFKKEKKEGEGVIGIKLPSLASGGYQVVVEVKDLFSLKRAAAGDAISIKKLE